MFHKAPVRHTAAYCLVALSAAFLAYKQLGTEEAPALPQAPLKTALPKRVPQAAAASAGADELASQRGMLWDREPGASRARPINAEAFAGSAHWQTADRVSLVLTPDLAPLDATVLHASTDATGTRVSHLAVAGEPTGALMLLENPEQHFFVAQLTYPGLSTAYEFRMSGNGLIGERKELHDLICASEDGGQLGLPPVAAAEAPAVPSITVAPATNLEGKANAFVVSLSGPTTATVKVAYQVISGSAEDLTDYRSKTGILTIRPKATSAKISIAGVKDTIAENDEQFTLLLSAPVNATLAEDSAVATIVDNDSAPSVRVFPAQVNEGTSDSRDMTFIVWLGKAAATPVTVGYTTVDGTATAGTDYLAVSGTLTIPRGKTYGKIKVPIFGDSAIEDNEAFTLQLSNAVGAAMAIPSAACTIVNDDILQVAEASPVPKFASKPAAEGVIYLDFDGHTCAGTSWKSGATITAEGIYDVLGEAGVKEVWERFVEAYAPFNVNVTTDENYFLNAPLGKRIRCVVTPSNEWYSNSAGGVAYVGSFKYTNDSPAWIFSDNLANSPKFIAIAGIHEVGHTLGLEHDGSSGDGAYYQGHGSGETSWAPAMGYGLYRNVVQWSRGEYYQATQRQDDTSIIAANPGIGHVADEDDNTAATARPLGKSAQGVIANANDVDVFQFTTQGGNVSIQAAGSGNGSKLDLRIEVRDDANQTVATANPEEALDASLSANLPAGTYTVHVRGSGSGTPTSSTPTGYTDYGSVGQYLVTSAIP